MIIAIFKDENFADNQATMKSTKLYPLKIIMHMVCLVHCYIAQVVLTEQYNINSTNLQVVERGYVLFVHEQKFRLCVSRCNAVYSNILCNDHADGSPTVCSILTL